LANIVVGDLPQAGDPAGPLDQDRVEVAEILADRLERHRRVGASAGAAQDQYPAAQFVGNVVGEGLDALFDDSLVDVELLLGDGQASLCEELQDPAGAGAGPVGGQRPDVGLVDGGVRVDPREQDAQAAGGESADLFVPAMMAGVVAERVEQSLGVVGERGQPVELADGDAAPVPAGVEQDALVRVGQVRGERRGRWPRGGRALPSLLVWCVVAERPGPNRESGCQVAAEPQLGPGLFLRVGAVLVEVQAAGSAVAGQQGNIGAPAALAVPATSVRFAQVDGSAALAWAQKPGFAQQCGGRSLGPRQVIEDLFGDLVVAVGVADGQRQPQHPADGPPPRGTEPVLAGLRHGRRAQPVVVGKVPVADTPRVVLGEPPAHGEQRELAADGGRAHGRVVSGSDHCGALTLQPGTRAARVARLAPQRPVDRLRPGRRRAGQDQSELARLPGKRIGDPARVEGADDLQAEPAKAVGVEMAGIPATAARAGVRVLPAPAGAADAVGELGLLSPAQADPALPDRPGPARRHRRSVRRQRPGRAARASARRRPHRTPAPGRVFAADHPLAGSLRAFGGGQRFGLQQVGHGALQGRADLVQVVQP
jgi:hypothetical protein